MASDLWVFHMKDESIIRLIMMSGLSSDQAMSHAGFCEHDVLRCECERGRV